ncbi:MAG: hypothetical protein COB50_03070 [Thiotrichales bacterium]|nr:MAG: hypothetical protein COB50_03070 [Thiotrichales bacterium]
MYRILSALILWIFLPEFAWAADGSTGETFSVPYTDYTLKLFGEIFGGNIGSIALNAGTHSNSILSNMFEKLNTIIMMGGVVIVSYVAVVSTINTAKSGEAMGKKWSGIWTPLRSMLGMLLMVPTPATGYSFLQVSIMWIVLQGVGAANAVWDIVLTQLDSGVPISGSMVDDNVYNEIVNNAGLDALAENLLNSAVCIDTFNDSEYEDSITSKYGNMGVYITNNPNGTKTYNFGINNDAVPPDSNLQQICGAYTVTGNNEEMINTKLNAVAVMHSSMTTLAEYSSNDNEIQGPVGYVALAKQAYASEIITLVNSPITDLLNTVGANPNGDAIKTSRELGWITAGSFYFVMTRNNGLQLSETAKALPSTAPPPPSDGNIGQALNPYTEDEIKTSLTKNLRLAAKNFDKDNPAGQELNAAGPQLSLPPLPSNAPWLVREIMDGVAELGADALKDFSESLTSSQGDPLLSIGSYGMNIMWAAEMGWMAIVIASFVAGLAAICSGESPLGVAMMMALITILPVVFGVLLMLWTTGAMLGIYTPLIPYMIFTTSVLGWAIMVIEAIIAAPIFATGLVMPSQDELGKIVPGLNILANIFLRPILMIFAFVIAARLLTAFIHLVNMGFVPTVQASISGNTLFGIVVVLIVYASFIIAITNHCFSLIYIIPDKIMRWIGGGREDGSPAAQIMDKTKAMSDQGTAAAGKAMKGSADSASKGAKSQGNSRKERIERGGSGSLLGGSKK